MRSRPSVPNAEPQGPEELYHFTTGRAAFDQILGTDRCTLRLSAYRVMGDPFEAKGWPIRWVNAPEHFDPTPGATVGWKHQFRKAMSRVKLLCLSMEPPGRPTAGEYGRTDTRAS